MIICEKNKCTGCNACFSGCPQNAIEMISDIEGFLTPQIDASKCNDCGLCKKICSNKFKQSNDIINFPKVYAAKTKDIELQKKSSSGGIFSVISNYIFDMNGIVYGAAFDENLECRHIRIDDIENLFKLRGSKYVQSEISNIFALIKEDLLADKFVLFTGTPCQVAGLKSFLNRDYEKLFCIDILCHGVPSAKLFKSYLLWLEKKHKSKTQKLEFRNKDKNDWSLTYRAKIFNLKGTKYSLSNYDPYVNAFLAGKTLRECCYLCDYANGKRVGDITIGDYWGIQKEHKNFMDYNGVSAVLLNNQKGSDIFDKVKSDIEYIASTLEKVSKHNHNLVTPTIRPEIRDIIYEKDIDFLYKETKKTSVWQKIKNLVPLKLKRLIKKVINK